MDPTLEPQFDEPPFEESPFDEPMPGGGQSDMTHSGMTHSDMNGGASPIKMLPANINAEQAVLGSLLIDPDVIIKIANFLRPEDFYRERHGWLYAAMLSLNERREPLDLVTLTDELERQDQLQEIGGPGYLNDLISSTPTAINVDYYARIVERTALLRRLISAAGKIAELAYDESQDSDQVVERAEQIIFGISESRIHRDLMPIHSIMQDVVNHLDFMSRNKDTLMGVPTGFQALDQLLGGFQQSDLIILAARPAMGKSSFALSVALSAAKNIKSRIALFSLEMSNDQMVQRLLSMETRIDSHRLRLGQVHDDEWDTVLTVANTLANTSVFIDDTPGATVNDIRTKSRRLYAEQGLDMIIIDYMQLMSAHQSSGGGGENRQQEISYISRSLKGLARELNVPVIALSQLSRAVESRADKRPMMSDLRESGCITGDSLVYLPDSGRYVPIKDLVGMDNVRVSSLNTDSMKLETCEVSNAFSTGEKMVFRLTTQLGRTIRATTNHKFLTIDGWKRLDKIEANQHIALPRILPSKTSGTTLYTRNVSRERADGLAEVVEFLALQDSVVTGGLGTTTDSGKYQIRKSVDKQGCIKETNPVPETTNQFIPRIRCSLGEQPQITLEEVKSLKIEKLSTSDVYWDKVVSIEPDGVEEVYDLTVPGNHNFVADNIIVHNSIEQDADVVMFIYREDYYIPDTDRQNIADIIVAKHRHGSTGTVSLYFRKELTQFSDMEIERTDLDY